mgnify:CR=1 FL=1
MTDVLVSVLICILLSLFTTLMFYEVLGVVMKLISRSRFSPRRLLIVMALGIMFAHSLSIFIYGAAYWLLTYFSHFPKLEGIDIASFGGYLYYSATSYTSLGVGDVYARGCLRIVSSFEVINGLTLIAWSATFTFGAVKKLWQLSSSEQWFRSKLF